MIHTNIWVFFLIEYTYTYMSSFYLIWRKWLILMSFNDFIKNYKLKNKATLNTKNSASVIIFVFEWCKYLFKRWSICIWRWNCKFTSSERSTLCVLNKQKLFYSYSCAPSQKLSNISIKRSGYCLLFKYKIQELTCKRESYCTSYCFHTNYLTKLIGIDFKSAVLKLYYQRNSWIKMT